MQKSRPSAGGLPCVSVSLCSSQFICLNLPTGSLLSTRMSDLNHILTLHEPLRCRSGSMWCTDRRPLPNAPGTNQIIPTANNRLGAVIASLYSFWIARQAAISQNAQLGGRRRDAYSLIFFSDNPSTCVENDFTSSPDQLLNSSLRYRPGGNENYTLALQKAQGILTSHWSTERCGHLLHVS